jgi:hypothetical protein
MDHIRYQLIHRTVSALIEAERLGAKNAMMLVHSFSQSNEWFNDYCEFLRLFSLAGDLDSVSGPVNLNGIDLYFCWVRGDKEYLEK